MKTATLPRPSTIAAWAACGVLVPACALLAIQPDGVRLAAIAVVMMLFAWLLMRRVGIAIGLLVVGVQNGLPFLDTARSFLGDVAVTNYMAAALVAILAVQSFRAPSLPASGTRLITVVGASLAVWWIITVARSSGEPLYAAAAFGRNFLTFALLLPMFAVGLRNRRDRLDVLATVCAGALLYSIGVILLTTSGYDFKWLIHPVAIHSSEVGLERVYSYMSDSVVLLFSLGVGAVLLATKHQTRRAGGIIVAVAGAAIVLQQTRAVYLTVPVALVVVLTAAALLAPVTRARLNRRALAGISSVLLSIVLLAVVAPHLLAEYGAQPLSRLNSVVAEVSTNTGNIGYRLDVTRTLLAHLNGDPVQWLTGLGFLDPKYRYFSDLPLGTINNSDLGVVDGIMLVGLVGVTMVYLVVAIPLWRIGKVARSWRTSMPEEGWLLAGLAVWLVQVLSASYSLGTLWQNQGQILSAMVVGAALCIAMESEQKPAPVPRRE